MRVLSIETPTHGRVLIEDATIEASPARILIGFHGYGQNAQAMLDEMRQIPGADMWRLVSVQALHRFYTRGDQSVVASWMTREDREHAIADNVEYVRRVVACALEPAEPNSESTIPNPEFRLVFLGFSQGASMAVRAAARVQPRASGIILLAGDIPPDIKDDASVQLPPTLIGCGTTDTWYSPRVEADVAFLKSRGVPHEVAHFEGGHEFTDAFRQAAGKWLSERR